MALAGSGRQALMALTILLSLSLPGAVLCADYFVNASSGDDGGAGSSEDPFKTISHAISLAAGTDTIYIECADDEYEESLTISNSGINLIGICQDKRRPIVSSEDPDSDTIELVNHTGRIQNLDITGATSANGINCKALNGGTNEADIAGCRIYGNEQGIHNTTGEAAEDGDDCSPHIVGNLVFSNHVRGIGNMWHSSAVIERNRVYQNGSGKEGQGGIGNRDHSTATIVNNEIYDNSRFGIGIRDTAAPSIVNNTIAYNRSSVGGGITVSQNVGILSVAITNNVIVKNDRGLVSEQGTPCDGNDYNDVWGHSLGNMSTNYIGFSAGAHEISQDPLFVNPENRDYHLRSSSPCIDAADSEKAPEEDLDGNPRPLGQGYDMGAHEYIVVALGDAIVALKILSGTASDNGACVDVNGDEKIGLEEAIYVLQVVAEVRP